MYNAPSVSYPVGRSSLAAALLSCAWAAGAGAVLFWAWQDPVPGWRQALALGCSVAAGAWVARAWWRSPQGELCWQGGGWTWQPAGRGAEEPGSVQVRLDLQRVLLVRWDGAAAGRWFWLERGHAPARWSDLRRAVYSRARPDALQEAQQPPATP